MARSIAEKRAKNQQQIANATMRDMRDAERQEKQHIKELIAIGRDFETAFPQGLARAIRVGMFQANADELSRHQAKWEARGTEILTPKEETLIRVFATFPEGLKLNRQARGSLAAEHLKEDRGFGLWRGDIADFAQTEIVVKALGGQLRIYSSPDDLIRAFQEAAE
jgi:hypothetical protein